MKKIILVLLEKFTGEKLFKALKEFFSTKSLIKSLIIVFFVMSYFHWSKIKNIYHGIMKIPDIVETTKEIKEVSEYNQRQINKIEYGIREDRKKAKKKWMEMREFIEIVAKKAEVSKEVIELYKRQTELSVYNVDVTDEVANSI